ncbi:hypothetical protein FKP32DRAFT_1671259 [Trametes sanguinea]|nr:hypothetical protein FKP32DRAFT_1671259 [Trametes sanguinea]
MASILKNLSAGIMVTVRQEEDVEYPYIPRLSIPRHILQRLGLSPDLIRYESSPISTAMFIRPWDRNRRISSRSVVVLRSMDTYMSGFPGLCTISEPAEAYEMSGIYWMCFPGWRLDPHTMTFHSCDFWVPSDCIHITGRLCLMPLNTFSAAVRSFNENYVQHLTGARAPYTIEINGYTIPKKTCTDDTYADIFGDNYGLHGLFYPAEQTVGQSTEQMAEQRETEWGRQEWHGAHAFNENHVHFLAGIRISSTTETDGHIDYDEGRANDTHSDVQAHGNTLIT